MKANLLFFAAFVIFVFSLTTAAQKTKISSVYTNLDTEKCKTLESSTEGTGWYRGECDGIGGYKLQVTEGDIRQSIDVITPSKKKYELNLTSNVSSAFSFVGTKAEWRVAGKGKTQKPVALIFRFNASNQDDETKNISYLVVTKITKNEICVTDVVEPSAKANEEARTLADAAATKPCKTPEE